MNFYGDKTWIEGLAVQQFNRILTLPGIIKGASFPDLHPGKGVPVGAAFLSEKLIYPVLIGNDIGCGMTLFNLHIKEHKFKKDKFFRKLGDDVINSIKSASQNLIDTGIEDPENMLGTIGKGNHFIEIVKVDKIEDEEKASNLNISKNDMLLIVHAGSRHYGENLWRDISLIHKDNGIEYDSTDGKDYLNKHAELIKWASYNRRLICIAVGSMISSELTEIMDNTHNSITPYGKDCFIHRKGTSNVESNNPVIVAGSRGTFSYLVYPVKSDEENLFSIAHGSGRKWNRQGTYDRIRDKYNDMQKLLKTKVGSTIICHDKNLLYEEAPEAYKDVSTIINDLKSFNLASVIAELKPVINIKP